MSKSSDPSLCRLRLYSTYFIFFVERAQRCSFINFNFSFQKLFNIILYHKQPPGPPNQCHPKNTYCNPNPQPIYQKAPHQQIRRLTIIPMRVLLSRNIPPQERIQRPPPIIRLELQQPFLRHNFPNMFIMKQIILRAPGPNSVFPNTLLIPQIIHQEPKMHLRHEIRQVIHRVPAKHLPYRPIDRTKPRLRRRPKPKHDLRHQSAQLLRIFN